MVDIRKSLSLRSARRLGSIAAVGMAATFWWHGTPAQVAGISSQGVASLTVLSTGANTNDSGYTSGQELQWVGTYQQLELSSIATQEHILSFGSNVASPTAQRYVSGSTVAPPGFKFAWNTGSSTAPIWSITEPAQGSLIRGVRYTYAPSVRAPVLNTVNFSGTGDGYRVIPYTLPINGKQVSALFIINHHTDGPFLKCRVADTGATCPTWPDGGYAVPKAAGAALVTSHVDKLWTPVKPTEHLDRATGRLYFPIGTLADNQMADVGIACADLIKKTSCGFVKTGRAMATASQSYLNGLATTDDGRMLFFQDGINFPDSNAKIHCFDTKTKNPCLNQPYQLSGMNNGATWNMASVTHGRYTFFGYRSGSDSYQLSCFDNQLNGSCKDFSAPDIGTVHHSLLPLLDTKGNIDGICLSKGKSDSCFNLDGTKKAVPSGPLSDWLLQQPAFPTAVQTYVSQKTKVYNFDDANMQVGCYDFATKKSCFPNIVSSIKPEFYAITDDPERPGCVWALGDASMGMVWDGNTGGACSQKTVTYSVDTVPVNFYGFDKTINGQVSYKKIVVANLPSSAVDSTAAHGVRATVFALNANGTPGEKLLDDVPLDAPTAQNPHYSLDLMQFAAGPNALTTPLTYKNFPRLRTSITIYRAYDSTWPDNVQSDVVWSGPAVQFSTQTKAPVNNTKSCQAASFVQSGIFIAKSTVGTETASTRAASNALLEDLVASGNGPTMLESSYLGYTRTDPKSGEGVPTVAMYPFYENNVFSGNLGFFDVTWGTKGAASPTQAKLADVHSLTSVTATNRAAYTSNADGSTVQLKWDPLDAASKDALNRNRGGILDNLGLDRVSYLRGDRSKEIGRPASNGIFHARSDRGSPCPVELRCKYTSTSNGAPDPGPMSSSGLALMLPGVLSGYSEALAPGYSAFQKQSLDSNSGRALPVVFANSNDGFLYAHTLSAGRGNAPGTLMLAEAFTYLPRRLIPMMSGYTDRNFSELGAFPAINDGSPLLADFCNSHCEDATAAVWRTALVSSFGRGIAGGHALDVTDVTRRRAAGSTSVPPVTSLWEFTDQTPVTTSAAQPDPAQYLGKQSAFPLSSFSNASLSTQVVRVKVGKATRWAWIIGNGYGSVAANAAGLTKDAATAVLYVVFMDGATNGNPEYVGLRLAGTAGMANGLSTPNPVDVNGDGTVDFVYAGDLQGHLWRVDLTGLSLSGGFAAGAAKVVMNATNSQNINQPIVGAPAVVPIGNTRRMVVFASGRPEITDARYLDNTTQHFSIIGLEDGFAPGDPPQPTAPPARSTCAARTLGSETALTINIKTGPLAKDFVQRSANTRSIAGDAMGDATCWALDLAAGETGMGNAAYNPVGQAVDVLSLESPSGSNSCSPGRSWINRISALTGKSAGIDVNGDGVINSAEAPYAGLSTSRSTGIVINNGNSVATGSISGRGNAVGSTGVHAPNAGRVWWREL